MTAMASCFLACVLCCHFVRAIPKPLMPARPYHATDSSEIANINALIPHFEDGVITVLASIGDSITDTINLNVTNKLPCGIVGSRIPSEVVLVPDESEAQTAEKTIPECLIIAIEYYSPDRIMYWIQKHDDGSIVPLQGVNKIRGLPELTPQTSLALSIQVVPYDVVKRDKMTGNSGHAEIDGGFSTDCSRDCPARYPYKVEQAGECSCHKLRPPQPHVGARGMEVPKYNTAIMSPEACRAMECINNDGRPALFNPFSNACWCVTA